MRILVQKFGGTSVKDLESMKRVQKKVAQGLASGCKVLVVLSARAGDTNSLIALGQQWSDSPDPAEMDVLVSTGEQVSVALFTMLLKDGGVKARSLLGGQAGIITDNSFMKARIKSIDSDLLKKMFKTYDVLVLTGFQGVTPDGCVTTLGRGGSDTSAVAVAAALKAELCEIYTDVEGVYTTDPNVCPKARKLDKVSYDEMLEMASMGAKVLEIRSVEFAKKFKVPVLVRSTFSEAPGTLVTKEDSVMEHIMVSSIAYDKNQARITLRNVPDKPGVAASVFGPLSADKLSVDMIVQNPSRDGVTDISFTVTRKELKRAIAIMEKLVAENTGMEVYSETDIAKVSVIGVGMRNHSGVAAKVFNKLHQENINLKMISTSEIKISCVIDEKYTELAVRVLHDEFGLDNKDYMEDSQ
jgi:aspartate kinase, monofunctional class